MLKLQKGEKGWEIVDARCHADGVEYCAIATLPPHLEHCFNEAAACLDEMHQGRARAITEGAG